MSASPEAVSASTAETVAATIGSTLLASLPTILEALAVTNPQDAIIAAAAVVIAQDLEAAIKGQVNGTVTSAQLLSKFSAAGPAMTATSDAWQAYAKSAGVPETVVP